MSDPTTSTAPAAIAPAAPAAAPAKATTPAQSDAHRWADMSPSDRSARIRADAGAYADRAAGRPAGERWIDPLSTPAANQTTPGQPTPPGTTEKSPPAEKVKVGDVEVDPERFKAVMAEMAARESGQLSAPASPDAYELKLPDSFKPPVGLEFKINEADPLVKAGREWAHRNSLPQSAFEDLLGVYAGSQVQNMQTLQQARATELGKLGAAAPARMTAINTFLSGHLGAEDAKPLHDSIWTAGAVKSWEKLITKLTTGHGSSFSHANRENGRNDVSDDTYNSWSTAQRMNYSRTRDPNRAA